MGDFMKYFKLFMQLMPVVASAVETVAQATGKDHQQATTDVIQHLTPGQPNAAPLSGPSA